MVPPPGFEPGTTGSPRAPEASDSGGPGRPYESGALTGLSYGGITWGIGAPSYS